jgi:phosphoserine phosphatase RsbU/P
MSAESQIQAMFRDQLAEIIFGTIFLFVGLAACAIAAVRRRSGVRVFVWLGIWSAMYGARQVGEVPAVNAALPHWLQVSFPYLDIAITYLLVVVGTRAWLELSIGKMRTFLWVMVVAGLAIALAGVGFFVTGTGGQMMLYNNLLAVSVLLVLVTAVAVPKLGRRFFVLPDRGVLTVGTLVFAVEALYVNFSRPLHYETWRILDHFGFAALLFSFGYVALRMVLASERRLLSIENELEIARQLQFSILPSTIPQIRDIRIAAAYLPMTAVAGDFYEFLPVDEHRAGFLVADVSGHGVPAALIASMIKVATQSVTNWAHDPTEVLRRLGSILSSQLRGQFVSAAYLWIDMETRNARYSAAGHPPLLRWRAADGTLTRIESNGLLFGVTAGSDYPVCEVPLGSGDRFLLYTDGVVEPENAAGQAFGDDKLEQIMRENQASPAVALSERLLAEVRAWQPAAMTQQDDITLIVIDVL